MDRPTVVIGDRMFRLVRPRGGLPEGRALGAVSELALASGGSVYVFQRADPPVLVFDLSGACVAGCGTGEIYDARRILITPDDRVILVDRDAHQILI